MVIVNSSVVTNIYLDQNKVGTFDKTGGALASPTQTTID